LRIQAFFVILHPEKKIIIMKRSFVRTLFIIIAAACCTTACVRDNFKYYGYEDELEGYAPVDYIDQNHTWTLTATQSCGVNGIPGDAERVVILSGNPFTDIGVEIMGEVYTSVLAGRYANISYVAPQTLSTVYAAALDEDGNYLSIASGAKNGTITLPSEAPTGTPYSTVLQEMKYCFEAEYPKPGDWDYNDVVLSISKEITPDNTKMVALHVTLEAVGYLSQIAGAIRLAGYANDNVTITKDDATTFVREPNRERLMLTQKDVQFAALNGNAVIGLFDDAHLAMFHLASDGSVYRRYFNTIENPTSSNNGATQSPITVTYYINFDDANIARNFLLTEVDPFILVQYGTSGTNFWEVHTYPYKLTEVIYGYYNGAAQSYNNGFSWAVVVPDGNFRYPLEGQPIGMRKNSIVSGAYQTAGHSFGEWILDQDDAQDWYLYPSDGAVY
jgi:LruC domain-containing protein